MYLRAINRKQHQEILLKIKIVQFIFVYIVYIMDYILFFFWYA